MIRSAILPIISGLIFLIVLGMFIYEMRRDAK
jgi:hypothetical protein